MTEIATKVSTTPPARLFVVETRHTFRMRYLVESETAEGAEKVVSMQPDEEEWQQKFMGVTAGPKHTLPISREEAEEIHTRNDPSWLGSSWMPIDSVIMRSKNGT